MLGAPKFVGDLSACSVAVEFSKLVPGATVRLFGKSLIAEWTASRAQEAFSFKTLPALVKNEKVTAIQFLVGEGGTTSAGKTVADRPSATDLNAGAFAPTFECGECVWLFKCFPGAKVEVVNINVGKGQKQEVLGGATVSPDGTADVKLNRPLKPGDHLHAIQTACSGQLGGSVSSAKAIDGGAPTPLKELHTLPDTVVGPVLECATYMHFNSVLAGASVIITRTQKGKQPQTGKPICIPVTPFTLWGFSPPFQPGEKIDVTTKFVGCNKPVGKPFETFVSSNKLATPKILGTICPDSASVDVSGLVNNALVEITVTNGDLVNPVIFATLHFGATTDPETFELPVNAGIAPLVAGNQILVRQNLCPPPHPWSDPGSAVVQSDAPAIPSLFFPADNPNFFPGLAIISLRPTLSVDDNAKTECNEATKFEVQIATASTFGTTEIVFDFTYQNSNVDPVVPDHVLNWNTHYFWRARAFHKNGPGSGWSATSHFLTPMSPSGVPNPTTGGPFEFQFCQTCSGGFKSSFQILASDWNTAWAEAQKKTPADCFLDIGPCT